jgi:hypothetical protein
MKEQKPMRKQIEQAIRNARITLDANVVNALADTRLDELVALEADAGLDSDGTIVWIYEQVKDFDANPKTLVDAEIAKH